MGFIEGKEETLHFEEKKWIKITKEIVAGTLDSAFRNKYEDEIVIFWGDGTKEITSEFNIAHSYEEAGIYDVYAFNKDATDSEWFEDLVNSYVIKYNLNGGVADNPIIYTEETETFTLNNPTRDGYEFIGWTGTDIEELTMVVTIPKGSKGGREYTANWKNITYTMTYDLDGGSAGGHEAPTTKKVYYGQKIGSIYPASQIRKTVEPFGAEYIGEYWTIDGQQITEDTIWAWEEDKTASIFWFQIG